MINGDVFSRPARLGALISGLPEERVVHIFNEKRILVVIEAAFYDIPDARETFIFAVNQILRFCPQLSICVGRESADDLVNVCKSLATQIHGPQASIDIISRIPPRSIDAVINVGSEVLPGMPAVTVNSTGWVARSASSDSGIRFLPRSMSGFNPIGALAAGCQASAAAFLTLLGVRPTISTEISLFTHERGPLNTLAVGPSLPSSYSSLDAFLVGCGSVSGAWAYTLKRLPVRGQIQAIDCQSLRTENLGSYVSAGLNSVGRPKVTVVKELLSPNIKVIDRRDQWEFFKIWLRHGLAVPPLIVVGVDNVTTRHSVQRLWPETLIDMGTGGLESQVIVKNSRGSGQCLLNALSIPPAELDWAESLGNATGLDPSLIKRDPTGLITQAEIDAAGAIQKADLQAALGTPRCGFINRHTLEMEGFDPKFEPAAPFVSAFSGVVAAGETIKWLTGFRHHYSLHYQMSFRSGLDRALQMRCDPICECQCLTQ